MGFFLSFKKVFFIILLFVFILFLFYKSAFAQESIYKYRDNSFNLGKKSFIGVELIAKADEALNAKDGTKWPKLQVFLNNGTGFDGAYDYGDCVVRVFPCANPNLYQDNRIRPLYQYSNLGINTGAFTDLDINSSNSKAFVVLNGLEEFSKIDSTNYNNVPFTFFDSIFKYFYKNYSYVYPVPIPTKISFVYYNDYWQPDSNKVNLDRNIYIKEVKIFAIDKDTSEKTLLFSVSPTNVFYYGLKNKNIPSNYYALYFDKGLVNIEGIKDTTQNGLVNAFDKKEVQNIDLNYIYPQPSSPGLQDFFVLDKEGSFNVNVNLLPAFTLYAYNKGMLKKGDINLDGSLDIKDVLSYVQVLLKEKYTGELNPKIYSFNGSNIVTVSDLISIVQEIF